MFTQKPRSNQDVLRQVNGKETMVHPDNGMLLCNQNKWAIKPGKIWREFKFMLLGKRRQSKIFNILKPRFSISLYV